MKAAFAIARPGLFAALLSVLLLTGCQQHWKSFYQHPTVPALGSNTDPIWQNQETNAEMSDFVVYQHEFQVDTEWLNTDGEDHVKQIATRLQSGQDAQVLVERSRTTPLAGTEHGYPIHVNPKLDLRRRDIIARSLTALGISDADERVVVAPSPAQGLRANEAESAYRNGVGSGRFGSNGGFGGFFFGGFGGGGMF
jgi:hypothetical protein